MRTIVAFLTVAGALCQSACAPVPDTHASQEALWQQFGNQPVDTLLLAWGAPMAETHLTDGSRLISYQHTTTYEGSGAQSGCKVSFLAKPPQFVINNVALEGDANECYLLSQGRIGDNRIARSPTPPYTPYPLPYRRYPF